MYYSNDHFLVILIIQIDEEETPHILWKSWSIIANGRHVNYQQTNTKLYWWPKGTHVAKSGLCKDILKCGEDEYGSSAIFS